LRVRLADGVDGVDGVTVEDVSYDSLGCSISQASASVMTDLVIGKKLHEALGIHEEFLALMQSQGQAEPDEEVLEDAVAFAGVSQYPARIKCALLAWMAWKDATAQAVAGVAEGDKIDGVAGGDRIDGVAGGDRIDGVAGGDRMVTADGKDASA